MDTLIIPKTTGKIKKSIQKINLKSRCEQNMAKFAPNPVLSFNDDKKNKFVEFLVETEINFEEQELNIEWEFKVDYHDKENDDALIHYITRAITPKKSKVKQKIKEKVNRDEISVDMSKTEVAIKMGINPKE